MRFDHQSVSYFGPTQSCIKRSMKRLLGLKGQEGDSPLVTFASAERPFQSSSKPWPCTI